MLSTNSIPSSIFLPNALLAFGLVACVALPSPALAELEAHGPAFTLGYSFEEDFTGDTQDLRHHLPGWRFTFGDFQCWDEWLGEHGVDLSWVVDTSAGYIGGDRDTVEATVLPMFHLEPEAAERWVPFIEGGVGLTYNDTRGFKLGSRILFSDQIGAGLAYKTTAGARIGALYRIRHISHAGLWATANSGMNTHIFEFFYELPPSGDR